jgi:hypothetical protein
VESIDVLGVKLIRTFQGFGQRGFMARRQDKMDMIGHQTVTVHDQLETLGGIGQKRQKHLSIVIHEKDVLTVVATLRNVMGTTCYDYS